MLMVEYREIGWWYWLVTAGLLTVGVTGNPVGFVLAIGLTVFQLLHYIIRERSVTAFPIQVRFWYLILLIVAFPEPLRLIYWIPTIGTWTQLLFVMVRSVSLLPWNRSEQFSLDLLNKTFFCRPVRGNIKQGFAAAE
ncbi:MAG: hypothetical protein OES09_00235 [Gammaproteobacteria bacterium]|nr:hypothetical protein [Gammaproteobacteria bacterium]